MNSMTTPSRTIQYLHSCELSGCNDNAIYPYHAYILSCQNVDCNDVRVLSSPAPCQDTLDAAQNDAEHLVVDRLRKKAEYVEKFLGPGIQCKRLA